MSIGHPDPNTQMTEPPSPGQAAILVVDEDPAFQLGLKTFLREYVGFDKVFTARSGAEALDIIEKEESVEVVTLDYEMPKMNGIELLESLKNVEHQPLSVLMITGYPSNELEAEFRSFDSPDLIAAQFVSKPVEFEKLEPLVLKAHQDLLARKNSRGNTTPEETPAAAEPETLAPVHTEPEELEHTIVELEAKISAQSLQLDELKKEVRSQQSRWRTDVLLVIFLAAITWLAAEFGLFESLRPKWEKMKDQISETIRPVESETREVEAPSSEPATGLPPDSPRPQSDGEPL